MGTTLVMTLAQAHEVYLTHVGDSRIYYITRTGCHQVTTDDDLASREVRLGYAIYREALQYPSAGALIQALGMRNSAALHPNVRRLVIDEDCVFLLCSDGLSDFERVEQYWRSAVLPILHHKADIIKTVKTLIKIANERNGHDNVTVAIVYCQVKPKEGEAERVISWCDVESVLEDSLLWSEIDSSIDPLPNTEAIEEIDEENKPTSSVTSQNQSKSLKLIVLSLLLLVGVAVFSYLFLLKLLENQNNRQDSSPLTPEEQVLPRPSP